MSETELSPTKMVSRSAAIALGIICIILLVGLIGAFAYYIPKVKNDGNTISNDNNIINDDFYMIGDDNATISIDSNMISNLNFEISYLNSQINSLKNSLTNILNLNDSAVWVNNETINQGAGSYTIWTFSASYAGYVSVLVQASTASVTRVELIYYSVVSSYGVNFDQEITASAGYTAVFPLLPCSDVTVGVGNGNILSSATETVTVTYYY